VKIQVEVFLGCDAV